MEKLSNTTKRKKRKTRKCLDELRNRSRRKLFGNSFEPLANVCILECKTNNRLLTMDRLTLKAIFPKAIRSETITRPALTEIKQKQSVNLIDLVRDKVVAINATPVNSEIVTNTIKLNSSFDDNMPLLDFDENSLDKRSYSKNNDYDVKSSSSCKVFSPTTPTNKPFTLCKLLNKEDTLSSSLTSPSQTSHGDYRHDLYEEFMNELPSFFRQLTAVIKEDVIQNIMNNLQKLCVESCHREYEANILKCINGHNMTTSSNFCNQNEAIVENPLDYIRLDHTRGQIALGQRDSESSSAGSVCMATSLHSSTSLLASVSPRHVPASARVLDVVLYDTPEYRYYPHRLN